MQPASHQAVIALRDVDGVIGSFLVNPEGELVIKDLPAVFEASLFAGIGPRLLRLGEVLGREGQSPDTISLRFAEHRLYVKFLKRGAVLTVLSTLGVNAATLKMAVALTARRVEQSVTAAGSGTATSAVEDLRSQEREPPERISFPPDTQPSPPSSATRTNTEVEPKSKGRVLYRGRPI